MGIVRKMRFIETLREGERISEVYLCRHKQTAMTKAGKPYDSLTLQDKTGTLDAKIWDVSSNGIEEFDSLDYIYVMGDVTSFQGSLQLNVKRVKKMAESDGESGQIICRSASIILRRCIRNFWHISIR